MAPAAAEASVHQLPIRIVSRQLVKASNPSIEPHTAAVSNIDLYNSTGQFSMVCLYPNELPKAGSSFDDVVAAFVAGLPYFLNHFYPLCGRIATDPSSGLPELRCHNQGADLVVGEVDVALGSLDLGEAESLKKITLPFPDDVGLSVQLLSFACGRFAVVWGIDHLLADVFAAAQLIGKWSEFSRSGTIAKQGEPNHDRSVFRPRDQPSYGARVGELLTTFGEHRLVNVLTAHDSFVERLYYVEAGDLDRLRETASATGQRSSRAQAMSAYLWKVLAGVVAASRVPGERCRMGWWVDARQRLTGPGLVPVMPNYFGNATAYTLGDATVEELQRKPLADVAAMVQEAIITSVDYDEYVQEISDWVEEHKEEMFVESALLGLGSPTLSQTEFASCPTDTDFGFGQAAVAMPVFHYSRMSSGLMAVGARPAPAGGDGSWFVSACVWPRLAAALESDEQRIFKPLTADYLGLN